MIKIKLPELVQTAYAVPLHTSPDDMPALLVAAVKKHVPGLVRDMTLQFASGPAMTTEVLPMDKFPIPPDVLSVMGASKEQAADLAKCSYFIALNAVNIAAWPPYHELAARATAGALATEFNTFIIDLIVPIPMTAGSAISCLPDNDKPIRFADWLTVISSATDNSFWMTTRGLQRIGFPELQIFDVPPKAMTQCSEMLIGLAWTIARRFSLELPPGSKRASHFELPDQIELSRRDVAEAMHSGVLHGDAEVEIHLRFDGDVEDNNTALLTVIAPVGDKRPMSEYLTEICEKLLGADSRTEPQAELSSEMETAMMEARSSLLQIRERYVEKTLPMDGKLAVKFAVTDGISIEYIWGFVDAWAKPDEIQATCANDAGLNSQLRAGRPVQLSPDLVVDWAVFTKGKILEGGYTIKVLGY